MEVRKKIRHVVKQVDNAAQQKLTAAWEHFSMYLHKNDIA